MRRKHFGIGKQSEPVTRDAPVAPIDFDREEWLTAEEAATVLKKFRKKDGKPSIGAIHTMIWRGQLKARKFFGRLLFSRIELNRLVAVSPQTGG